MTRTLISVCTYNELQNIRLLIPELRQVAPAADVLIVDDSSPDGTGDVVKEMAATDSAVRLMSRSGKLGLGSANLEAFRYAIREGYDLLVNLDADFSHPPQVIPALIALTNTCDVAIGSRYVPGGAAVGWSLWRHFMSRAVNLYARLFLGLTSRDNSGSFRCYRVSCLDRIDWGRTLSTGYSFYEEVLYRCRQAGCSFAETPIIFEDRRFGETKLKTIEILKAVWVIFRLGLQRMRGVSVLKNQDT
ncbi:MAG: polyprenol monophosphomannose synthase [Planctomycetaceae bacterium]